MGILALRGGFGSGLGGFGGFEDGWIEIFE
jgi:hypothetical protein